MEHHKRVTFKTLSLNLTLTLVCLYPKILDPKISALLRPLYFGHSPLYFGRSPPYCGRYPHYCGRFPLYCGRSPLYFERSPIYCGSLPFCSTATAFRTTVAVFRSTAAIQCQCSDNAPQQSGLMSHNTTEHINCRYDVTSCGNIKT